MISRLIVKAICLIACLILCLTLVSPRLADAADATRHVPTKKESKDAEKKTADN